MHGSTCSAVGGLSSARYSVRFGGGSYESLEGLAVNPARDRVAELRSADSKLAGHGGHNAVAHILGRSVRDVGSSKHHAIAAKRERWVRLARVDLQS